jgi:hypothetical protein
MFLVRFVKIFQIKYAKIWLHKFPKEAALRFHLNNANQNQGMFVVLFLEKSANNFKNRFQLNNAKTSQGRFAEKFRRRNVALFLNKNAKTKKSTAARMCVRMSTGVKNAHLHNVTFGF